MKRFLLLALPVLIAIPCRAQVKYPATKTVDVADTYFGTTYNDAYRWLENLKDADVEAWFKAQAELTDGLLAKIPAKDALVQEWMALDKRKPASYSAIRYENGLVFYKKTLGGENVGKLYFREGWNGAEKLLFDPATYKEDGKTTIQFHVPSWDGKYEALGFSSHGAEISEIRVMDVKQRTLLPDRIYPTRLGVFGWLSDGKSFFYDAGKITDLKSLDVQLHHKSKVHTLGTDPARDRDVFSDELDPDLGIAAKDLPISFIREAYPRYVVGRVASVQREEQIYYAPVSDLKKQTIQWNSLCKRSDNLVRAWTFAGDYIYAVTYNGAPRYKIVRTSVTHPDWQHAETVVPEAADTIQYFSQSKHYLMIVYSDGVSGRLAKYNLATGKTSQVKLPATGILDCSCPDWKSDRCLVTIDSWTLPQAIYDYDAEKDTFTKSVFNSDAAYPEFADIVSEEVQVPGHDGVMIPLSIIHRKGTPLDGSSCCILEGYGAYGISTEPSFDLIQSSLAARGVVMARAHVRGGGEKGQDWYRAGYKTTKPNTWKDFISCAEYLIKKGYTSPQRLAGTGTSAGGVLISRAITERPDLFAAAVCNVGVANAMRAEFTPNGPINTPEFGTVKDPVECQALFEMDGVQHVQKDVKYPAVLGVGGWNDPRVAPWEPGKFVAAVQTATTSDKPVLMKVNYDNGHFTEEKTVTFNNFAAQYTFLLWQTGHKDFQPVK